MMQTNQLYKYDSTVTPRRRNDGDPVYAYRLIAEEGMELTNGEDRFWCIDTHTPEAWYEVPRDEEIAADDLVEELEAML